MTQEYISQPCWSNASLVSTLTENARAVLRANPSTTMIVVDQMDGNQLPWLICPTDRAANARLNSTGGAMFEAVNHVAAALESEFPTVTIMTEASSWTRPHVMT